MPRQPSDFVIFEDTRDSPIQESQGARWLRPKGDITALQNHIKNLHEQTTALNHDLLRLHRFINQPLLDKPILGEVVIENAYKAARQKIAIRYASNELKSISNAVVYIDTHISNADLLLVHLKNSLGLGGIVSKPSGGNSAFNKASEMMLELWDIHESTLELESICKFALEHETVAI